MYSNYTNHNFLQSKYRSAKILKEPLSKEQILIVTSKLVKKVIPVEEIISLLNEWGGNKNGI